MIPALVLLAALGRTPSCDVQAENEGAGFSVSPTIQWVEQTATKTSTLYYVLECRPAGAPSWTPATDTLPCRAEDDGTTIRCPGLDWPVSVSRCGDPVSGELWEYRVYGVNEAGLGSPSAPFSVCYPLSWFPLP